MRLLLLILSLSLLACDPSSPAVDAGSDAGSGSDAGVDAGSAVDAGVGMDAGPVEDAGSAVDAGVDAGSTEDAGADAGGDDALLRRPGCHLISAPDDIEELPFGEVGTEHGALIMRFRIESGPWREDAFDRPTLNHNLFNLYRNDGANYRRYLLGLAAQISPMDPGLARRAIFYSRVELAMGFMSYVSFRGNAAWRNGRSYEVEIRFDVDAQEQVLTITEGGTPIANVRGDIPYVDRSHTTSGFYLHLGGAESDGREVSAVGWSICDVVVTAER
jgi:hypothetical protein